MFIAFGLEGIGIYALYALGQDPVWFVLLSGLVFFAWGEIYSLFPSTCADTYGDKNATANAGLLYTAKGTASLLVPLTSVLAARGGWGAVFYTAAAMNLVAAAMAMVVLVMLFSLIFWVVALRLMNRPRSLLRSVRCGLALELPDNSPILSSA